MANLNGYRFLIDWDLAAFPLRNNSKEHRGNDRVQDFCDVMPLNKQRTQNLFGANGVCADYCRQKTRSRLVNA